jgi:hypothetical protein
MRPGRRTLLHVRLSGGFGLTEVIETWRCREL